MPENGWGMRIGSSIAPSLRKSASEVVFACMRVRGKVCYFIPTVCHGMVDGPFVTSCVPIMR